jgi:6-phosphogluconate dehydrogenase
MDIGIWGLGRMGFNMARRLVDSGEHRVVAGNRSPGKVDDAVEQGAESAYSVEEMVEKLNPPRVLWSMLPAGDVTDEMIDRFVELADEGDIIIDGANSYYKDSIRRAEKVRGEGLKWLDAGVSGGIWGYEVGYCTMVGGDADAFEYAEPVFKTLAPPDGYAYLGDAGAGHFAKMVHNGVEYGMMQAYAEGFDLMHTSDFPIELKEVAGLWNRGSVVRSWLCELAERAFEQEGNDLSSLVGYVDDSGEGRWMMNDGIEMAVPTPALAASLFARFYSRKEGDYAARVLAALRNQFGGHAVKKVEET